MIDPNCQETIDAIARILGDCRSILFITGAGVSAESGIPTYCGVGGLYNVDTTEEGYEIEEVLSGLMLTDRPELTWKYFAQIGRAASGATFNRAHEVIAEMETHFPRARTLTQNVDGFHLKAGSKNVIEAHGNMYSLSCTGCKLSAEIDEFLDDMELPPKCPSCGAMVRPNVVLFGEMPHGDSVRIMTEEVEKGFDVVFSIGTSSVFPYIQAPLEYAKMTGSPTIEINPSKTFVTPTVDYHLPMKAGVALNEIWDRFQKLVETA